jgi:uncharacterized protein (TIGR00369 family)
MIKKGFKPHFRKSPLTAPWEPLYSQKTKDAVIIGLLADSQHCNSRGFVHGGLISAIADNALGLSCSLKHPDITGLVTISLHLDFTRAAQKGEWLEFETSSIKPGKSIDMAQGQVYSDGKLCALVGATFNHRSSNV